MSKITLSAQTARSIALSFNSIQVASTICNELARTRNWTAKQRYEFHLFWLRALEAAKELHDDYGIDVVGWDIQTIPEYRERIEQLRIEADIER